SPWIGSTKTAATLSGGATVWRSRSIRARDWSVETPRDGDGYSAWKTEGRSGANPWRWADRLAVSESAPNVRPWNPPRNARKLGRRVAWRASFIALFIASAPELVKKACALPAGMT